MTVAMIFLSQGPLRCDRSLAMCVPARSPTGTSGAELAAGRPASQGGRDCPAGAGDDRRSERFSRNRDRWQDRLREGVWQGAAGSAGGGDAADALQHRLHQQAIYGDSHSDVAAAGQAEARRSDLDLATAVDARQRSDAARSSFAYLRLSGLLCRRLLHAADEEPNHGRRHYRQLGQEATRLRSGNAMAIQQYELCHCRKNRGDRQRNAGDEILADRIFLLH